MSALPSNQQPRPRTMASDISKLFRSVSTAPQRPEKHSQAPTSSGTPTDRPGSTKKKITRIPLFGRTRKKSNQSSSSSPYASTNIIRESTDVGEMSSRPPSAEPERRPSLPSLSAPTSSPSKLSPSSFTSKFAAHFSSSQSTKSDLPLDSRASSSRTSLTSAPSSSALAPPRVRPSYESGSSTGSRTRSTTPRGARPVIMVSTTDNMDEFKDLFTKELPTSRTVSKPSGSSQDSDATQAPASRSAEPTTYRRGQTPASVLAASIRDQQTHQRQPSASSSRQTTDSEKTSSNEKSDGRSTPRLSSARESPPQLPEKDGPPQTHSRRPSTSQGYESLVAVRSRMRPPSSLARTKPPSIPLPEIPTTADLPSPKKTDGADNTETDSRPAETNVSVRRPRANTFSSIPELSSAPSPAPLVQNRPARASLDPVSAVDVEDIEIDTASSEHLRRALRSRNKQLEELTAYMLRREETWSAERKAMEKKIASLQRDLVRRESEITGLKLIINDEDVLRRPKALPGILNHSRLSPGTTSPVQSDQEGSIQSHTSGGRRLNYQSDSGAESPRGSGNESSSSLLRLKRMHQRSSAIRLPKFAQSFQEKPLSETSHSKRVSTMSVTSSASSGSSSLMPPSPSVTMSSLSAIPEGGGPPENPDSEDRRALLASRRISASSTSSSTAASSVYSANIKRSRPPSIAQVLEKSPNIDNVLEKLRPFA